MRCLCILTTILLVMLGGITNSVYAGQNEIETMCEKWLTANFPETNSRWEVWILSATPDLENLDRYVSYRVTGVEGTRKPKKIMVFHLTSEGEDTNKVFTIRTRVVKYIRVPVTNKIIRKGIAIKRNDWNWEERNSESLVKDVIRNESDLKSKRAKKVLTRGEVITAHALEKIPDVKKGQKMTLRVYGSGVVLSTDAISIEEGNIEDWVKLRAQNSGQIIKAMIVSSDLARIVLPQRR